MTEISFHFNVPDRTLYACRLLRKAGRRGNRVAVTGPAERLTGLDRALWGFDSVEFLPHLVVRQGDAATLPRLRATPIWLVERTEDAPHHDVLVNLGEQLPEGFESFGRVIEIVSVDESERLAARQRWKHYANRGYAIDRHEVGA